MAVTLLLWGIAPAWCITALDANSNWQVRVWRKPVHGMSMMVKGLTQTGDGLLWFATTHRLARFDGLAFDSIKTTNVFGNDRNIDCLFQCQDGAVWVAADSFSLARLASGRIDIFENQSAKSIPRYLTEDGEHALWISCDNGSVFQLKDGKFSEFGEEQGLPGHYCPHLATDRKGRLWFSVSSKVGMFRNGKFEVLKELGRFVRIKIARCSSGDIWICENNELLKYSEGKTPESCGFFTESIEARPSAILETRDGSVWIGTQTGGLFHYNGTTFESVPTSHSMITTLLEDREGCVWVGTPDGLNQIRRRAIVVEGSSAVAPSQAIGSLAEDHDGNLWAATKDGKLVIREGNSWKPFPGQNQNVPSGVTRVTTGPAGELWIATRESEIRRWHRGKWTIWNSSNGIVSERIFSLVATHRGDVWAAGRQPARLIHLFDDQVATLPLSTETGFLRTIAEDGNGTIWMGGDEASFISLRDGEMCETEPLIHPATASIRCIYPTRDGALWIAGASTGLCRRKGAGLALLTGKQGLYDDDIRQIVADDYGYLWFGSARGLFKVSLDQLNAVADGKADRVQSICYGRNEDLPDLEAGAEDCGSAIRTRDGRLWIPMGMALAVIDPAKLPPDCGVPPAFIKEVSVDEKVIASYRGVLRPDPEVASLETGVVRLQLPPDHRRIELAFAAPNLRAPGDVSFRYRMEGFDQQWIRAELQPKAVYSRLAAGQYHFRLQARTGGSEWKESTTQIALTVAPFFWATWWFRTSFIATSIAAVAGLIRLVSFRRLQSKLHQLERESTIERERSRIAQDLHDDLGSGMTEIILLNELSMRNRIASGDLAAHARKIANAAQRISQSLHEAVWAINPSNDASPHLIEYLGQYAIEFLEAADIRCRLDFADDLPQAKVSSDVRHHLLCATKEALNNAVRHGHPNEVRLQIEVIDRQFQITIRDNGSGFDTHVRCIGGHGLDGMQTRLEKIGGRCQIHSEPGAGTTVCFRIPLSQMSHC